MNGYFIRIRVGKYSFIIQIKNVALILLLNKTNDPTLDKRIFLFLYIE